MARTKINYPQLQNEWWEELGRTTLGVAGDTITVNNIPTRAYLLVISYCIASGQINPAVRFNNDSGNNYALRYSQNGAADSVATSQNSLIEYAAVTENILCEIKGANVAAQAKILSSFTSTSGASGAGNSPGRQEGTMKWHNTTDQITRVDVFNGGTGDFGIGSYVVVLGHD